MFVRHVGQIFHRRIKIDAVFGTVAKERTNTVQPAERNHAVKNIGTAEKEIRRMQRAHTASRRHHAAGAVPVAAHLVDVQSPRNDFFANIMEILFKILFLKIGRN